MPQRSNLFKSHWSNQWLTFCAVRHREVIVEAVYALAPSHGERADAASPAQIRGEVSEAQRLS